jgi:DNA-directed RNA polymerase subunit RPC12/RpoP
MADFVKKYQQWLSEFNKTLKQLERRQLDNMLKFGEHLNDYLKASKDLSAYETTMFVETLKRQWREHNEQEHNEQEQKKEASEPPSLWPEALWQQLSGITDKSQIEWQELAQDFKHQGVYYQGEMVGMGRYRCSQCLKHIDYTHPMPLAACSHCDGVQFFREGLPV